MKQRAMWLNRPVMMEQRSFDLLSALHVAAFGGHIEIVKLLLEYGAEANLKNDYGSTPFHIAAGHS